MMSREGIDSRGRRYYSCLVLLKVIEEKVEVEELEEVNVKQRGR
jgi:hypothetical protein